MKKMKNEVQKETKQETKQNEIKQEEVKKEEPKQETKQGEMSDELMMSLLVELSETMYWQAIKRFNNKKLSKVLVSLATLDSFKNPTEVARAQGIRLCLNFLEEEINREKEERSRIAKGEPRRTLENQMPSYNG